MAKGKCSYELHIDAPVLPLSRIKFFNSLLDVDDPRERYYSTLLVTNADLKGWPATHFLVAGRDPLLDEALLFEEKLKQTG
jgi:acetyl esterase/lipase